MAKSARFLHWSAGSLAALLSASLAPGQALAVEGDCGGRRIATAGENHVAWLDHAETWPDRFAQVAAERHKQIAVAWGVYVDESLEAHQRHLVYVRQQEKRILEKLGFKDGQATSGELPPVVVFELGAEDPDNPGHLLPGSFVETIDRDTLMAPDDDKDRNSDSDDPSSPNWEGPGGNQAEDEPPSPGQFVTARPSGPFHPDIVISYPAPEPAELDAAIEEAKTVLANAVAPGATLMDEPLALLATAADGARGAGGKWMPPLPDPLSADLVRVGYLQLMASLAREWAGDLIRDLSAFECLAYYDLRFLDLFGFGGKLDIAEGVESLDDAIALIRPFYPDPVARYTLAVGDATSTIRLLEPRVEGLQRVVNFTSLSIRLLEEIGSESTRVEAESDSSVALVTFQTSGTADILAGLSDDHDTLSFLHQEMVAGIADFQSLRAREDDLEENERRAQWGEIFYQNFLPRLTHAYVVLRDSKEDFFSDGGLQVQVLESSDLRAPVIAASDQHRNAVRASYENLSATCDALTALEEADCN